MAVRKIGEPGGHGGLRPGDRTGRGRTAKGTRRSWVRRAGRSHTTRADTRSSRSSSRKHRPGASSEHHPDLQGCPRLHHGDAGGGSVSDERDGPARAARGDAGRARGRATSSSRRCRPAPRTTSSARRSLPGAMVMEFGMSEVLGPGALCRAGRVRLLGRTVRFGAAEPRDRGTHRPRGAPGSSRRRRSRLLVCCESTMRRSTRSLGAWTRTR